MSEKVWERLTGRELDRCIAEHLGWTQISEASGWIEDLHDTYEKTYLEGIPPDGERFARPLPEWSVDTDTALTLPLDGDNYYFAVKLLPNHKADMPPYVVCEIFRWLDHVRVAAYSTDAEAISAVSICRAWCAWKFRTDRE